MKNIILLKSLRDVWKFIFESNETFILLSVLKKRAFVPELFNQFSLIVLDIWRIYACLSVLTESLENLPRYFISINSIYSEVLLKSQDYWPTRQISSQSNLSPALDISIQHISLRLSNVNTGIFRSNFLQFQKFKWIPMISWWPKNHLGERMLQHSCGKHVS